MSVASRTEGFGDEVKLRILLGTYVLRSGFQDEYYLRAQKIRTAIRMDFEKAFGSVDLVLMPVYPVPPFVAGQRRGGSLLPEARRHLHLRRQPRRPSRPFVSRGRGERSSHRHAVPGPRVLRGTAVLRLPTAGEGLPFALTRRVSGEGVVEMYSSFLGLEVHTQLLTRTKVFCGCRAAFGDEPNTNVCPVCMGYPGVLPTLNETAMRMGYLVARALNCTLSPSGLFERKNYFYPDLPKNYQISQFRSPLGTDGMGGDRAAKAQEARAHPRGAPGGGCRQDDPRRGHHPAGLQPDRHARCWRSSPSRTWRWEKRRRSSSSSCAAWCATSGSATATWRKVPALRCERLGEPRGQGPGKQGGGEEPQLVQVRAQGHHFEIERQTEILERGGGGDLGDAPVEREPGRHGEHAHQGELLRLPLFPRAGPAALCPG